MIKHKDFNPRRISALALDLDGTILGHDNRISDRTLGALRECKAQGIRLILCTGRAPESAEPYRAALEAEGPQVYFNGALTVQVPGNRVLDSALLERAVLDFCVDLSRKRGVYFQLYLPVAGGAPGGGDYSGCRLIAERPGAEAEQYQTHSGRPVLIRDLREVLAGPDWQGAIKGMFIAEPEALDPIRGALTERFGPGISLARSHRTFLELMAPGASKGRGLAAALKTLGLESAGVIAFGDEENDLPLFQAAGFSAAPANAKAQVLAAADFTLGPHDEEGVAVFLEERLLAPRGAGGRGLG